jgi:Carboxypeptidase regulatory-like domain
VSPVRITPCFRHLFFFGLLFVFIITATLKIRAQDDQTGSSAPISVSGQVVNAATGAGISRVLIKLNGRAVLTDHEGKFQFDQFTGTGISLQATKPGFYLFADPTEGSSISLQSAQLAAPIQVRLYPEAVLTGTVTAPDGEPLQNVPVMARRSVFDETTRRWIPVAQSQTDSHGNFRLPVPPGDYRVETRYTMQPTEGAEVVLPVSVPTEVQSSSSNVIHVGSGEEMHFDLHPAMSRAYNVTARVEIPSERGFPGITARSSSGTTIPVTFQRTGVANEGKLQLPAGTYTLTASMVSSEGSVQGETTVTVPNHDVSGVVLHLAPNPSIPVELVIDSSVTSDNSSPPNIQQLGLVMESTDIEPERGGDTVQIETGRNGIPSFNVAPGSYRLQARTHGTWYVMSASYGDSDLLDHELVVGVGAGGAPIRVTVSDQNGSLQGTTNLNGVPAACWIYLIPTFPSASPVIALRSGSNGAYNEAYLPPGSYQAVAFEHRHSADYRDPDALAPYTTHVRSVTVNEGDKPSLNLDAVTAAEVVP